ncbi:MAG: cytochrome P450 [Halarchaeum sp.]
MAMPPRPAGDPFVGHTLRFARRPFALPEEAMAANGGRATLDVLGAGSLVLTAHPEDVPRVLDRSGPFGKTADFETAFGESVIATEGDVWKRQREVLDPLFRPSRIREYADAMVECTRDWVADWTPGERIDLESEMKALTLEVLFATLFGRDLDPDADAALYESAAGLNAFFRPTSWALPAWVPTPSRREFARSRETLRAEVTRLIDEHDGGDGDTILGRVLAARDDDALDDEAVRDVMVGIVFAGHETTALTLAFALHALGRHDDVRARVHAEADALDGDPGYGDVDALDATGRAVTETLRRYPAIHSIPRVAREDAALGPYDVPEGAQVLVSVYRAHRDPERYRDPEAFDPTRWAETPARERDPHDFFPFGRGARACLGRRFARVEAQLVLATIARRYRLDPLADLELAPAMTTQPADGVPARVRER